MQTGVQRKLLKHFAKLFARRPDQTLSYALEFSFYKSTPIHMHVYRYRGPHTDCNGTTQRDRVPSTVAVRVQLYNMASSPNTLPDDMTDSFCPLFVTSSSPSVNHNGSWHELHSDTAHTGQVFSLYRRSLWKQQQPWTLDLGHLYKAHIHGISSNAVSNLNFIYLIENYFNKV